MPLKPADIVDLGEWLRDRGHKVTPAQLISAGTLVTRRGIPDTPADLGPWLAPIFCTDARQQAAFGPLFDGWLKSRGLARPEAPRDAPSPSSAERAAEQSLHRRLTGRAIALAALLLLVLAAAVVLVDRYRTRTLQVVVQQDGKPTAGARLSSNHHPESRQADPSGHAAFEYNRAMLPLVVTANHPTLVDEAARPLQGHGEVGSPRDDALVIELPLPPAPAPASAPTRIATADVTWLRSVRAPPPTRGRDVRETVKEPDVIRIGALVGIVLLVALWWLWERLRRHGFLQRLPADDDATEQQLRAEGRRPLAALQAELRHLGRELRRRVVLPSRELDIAATLRATVRQGGRASLVFGTRVEPEHLVLIDRASHADHQARLADDAVAALYAQGVQIERYLFDEDPQRCHHAPFESQSVQLGPQSLAQLAGRHPGARLIIFTDGRGLIDPMTGRPNAALEELSHWPQPVLVTPQARHLWGTREWRLASAGLAPVPLDGDGLLRVGDLLTSGVALPPVDSASRGKQRPLYLRDPDGLLDTWPPDAATLDELVRALAGDLEPQTHAWLCGLAVYPEVHWGITLAVGEAVQRSFAQDPARTGPDGSHVRRLAELSRLPWLRHGHMPDWLRERLVDQLPPRCEAAVRDALAAYLASLALQREGDDRRDAVVIARPAGEVAPWKSLWHRFVHWSLGDGRRRRAGRDLVFLRFLSGRPQRLAVRAVDRLLWLLYHEGVPLLGPRAAVPLLVAVACAGVSWRWPPTIQFVHDQPGAELRVRPAVLALNADGSRLAIADDDGSVRALALGDRGGPADAGESTATTWLRPPASSGATPPRIPAFAWSGTTLLHEAAWTAVADAPAQLGTLRAAPTGTFAPSAAARAASPAGSRGVSTTVNVSGCKAATRDGATLVWIGPDVLAMLPEGDFVACALSPSATTLALIDSRGALLVLSLRDGAPQVVAKPVAMLPSTAGPMAVSDDGRTVAVRLDTGGVLLVRGADRQQQTLQGEAPGAGATAALALSGDGQVLAAAMSDRQVQLWRLAPGKGTDYVVTFLVPPGTPQVDARLQELDRLRGILLGRYGFNGVGSFVMRNAADQDMVTQWLKANLAASDRLVLLIGAPWPGATSKKPTGWLDNDGPLARALAAAPTQKVLIVDASTPTSNVLVSFATFATKLPTRPTTGRTRLIVPTNAISNEGAPEDLGSLQALGDALARRTGPTLVSMLRGSGPSLTARIMLEGMPYTLPWPAAGDEGGDFALVPRTPPDPVPVRSSRQENPPLASQSETMVGDWRSNVIYTGTKGINSASCSADGRVLATATTEDNGVRIFDTLSGALTHELANAGWNAPASANGRDIYTASAAGEVTRWDSTTGKAVMQRQLPMLYHGVSPTSSALSRDGRLLAMGYPFHPVVIVSTATLQVQSELGAPSQIVQQVQALAFAQDGRTLFVARDGHGLEEWSVATGKVVRSWMQEPQVHAAALSPDGRTLAFAGWMLSELKLLDVASGEIVNSRALGATPKALAWHPSGTVVLTGQSDGTIAFWNAQTLARVGMPLKDHTDWVNDLAWCGGDTLASASSDKTIRLWRRQAPQTKAPAYAMDPYVTSPANAAPPQAQNAAPQVQNPASQAQNTDKAKKLK